MANTNLRIAKANKKDEFYTLYKDIENELQHYVKHFENKTVYCNCDDYRYSNFWKYFKDNFEQLGLKKLIATCYIEGEQGLKAEYDGSSVDTSKLVSDGSFNSYECCKIMEISDVIVTNPPFSLFRNYIKQLMDFDKKFIIVGSLNSITYKDVFPLIKDNQVWLGKNQGSFTFEVPMNFEKNNTFIKDDMKYAKFGNIVWYTNLDIDRKHKDIELTKLYDKADHPKYDNYDAINVDKVKDIPRDYDGVMGVPITFIDKHNPEQFEIVGIACGNSWANYKSILKSLKFNPNIKYGGGLGNGVGIVNSKGKYARILIKRR